MPDGNPSCAQIPHAILDNLKYLTTAQGIILIYLAARTVGVGHRAADVRIAAIHRDTGISVRCIYSSLKVLNKLGVIERTENLAGSGARLANTYAVALGAFRKGAGA